MPSKILVKTMFDPKDNYQIESKDIDKVTDIVQVKNASYLLENGLGSN
jgi:hypothetical protein